MTSGRQWKNWTKNRTKGSGHETLGQIQSKHRGTASLLREKMPTRISGILRLRLCAVGGSADESHVQCVWSRLACGASQGARCLRDVSCRWNIFSNSSCAASFLPGGWHSVALSSVAHNFLLPASFWYFDDSPWAWQHLCGRIERVRQCK